MKMSLSVKNQSVESSGITKDFGEALCEYIWNGFEANATQVKISCVPNMLKGIETIIVSDNGDGIIFDELSDTFGAFLASQKNSLSLKAKTKANKGKGRFSFSAFSSIAKWDTVYNDGGILKSFSITLSNARSSFFPDGICSFVRFQGGRRPPFVFFLNHIRVLKNYNLVFKISLYIKNLLP